MITIKDVAQWNTQGAAYMQAYNDYRNGVDSTDYNQYKDDMRDLKNEFYSKNPNYTIDNPYDLQNFHSMSGIYALMQMLGDAINIYVSKNDINNLNFEPHKVDNNDVMQKVPCS